MARARLKDVKDNILILCVDRDNDLGDKAGVRGPIIGREKIMRAASSLAIADPEDSDANALFQTVRIYDQMKREHKLEAAVLTGDSNVGVVSDSIVAKQLDIVLEKFNAKHAILVTDGAEDEHTIPIIQSRLPILSVQRVIVKQAEKLESTYYTVKTFISESLEDPKLSGIVFGMPAVALILFGVFGFESLRYILGVVGLYLFVRGFKLEKHVLSAVDELRTSFDRRRFAFFTYVIAIVFTALGIYRGYRAIVPLLESSLFHQIAGFVAASVYLFFIAFAAGWTGRNISTEKRRLSRVVAVPIFGMAVSIVIFNSTQLVLTPSFPMIDFILSIALGFILVFIALLLEWKA